jgi:hypothetical protein
MDQAVMLTSNLQLASRLRISGAILLVFPVCLRGMGRDNFTFVYPKSVILEHTHTYFGALYNWLIFHLSRWVSLRFNIIPDVELENEEMRWAPIT